jgi:hypothetical protein
MQRGASGIPNLEHELVAVHVQSNGHPVTNDTSVPHQPVERRGQRGAQSECVLNKIESPARQPFGNA